MLMLMLTLPMPVLMMVPMLVLTLVLILMLIRNASFTRGRNSLGARAWITRCRIGPRGSLAQDPA
eukprot:10868581-Lingulodinium_polyedra.AAC.1